MYWKEWLTQVTSSSGVAYTWPYWGEQSTTETVDMEHAEISMRFAVDYFQTRRGSHLNLSDMQALARTVRDGIVCGPGPISFLDILVCGCLSWHEVTRYGLGQEATSHRFYSNVTVRWSGQLSGASSCCWPSSRRSLRLIRRYVPWFSLRERMSVAVVYLCHCCCFAGLSCYLKNTSGDEHY